MMYVTPSSAAMPNLREGIDTVIVLCTICQSVPSGKRDSPYPGVNSPSKHSFRQPPLRLNQSPPFLPPRPAPGAHLTKKRRLLMYSGSVLEKTYTSSVGAQEPSASWRLWRGAAGSSACRSRCSCCCVPAAAAAAAPSLADNPPDLLMLPLALPLTAVDRGEAGERCNSSRPVHSAQQSSSAAAAAASVRMDGGPPLRALV